MSRFLFISTTRFSTSRYVRGHFHKQKQYAHHTDLYRTSVGLYIANYTRVTRASILVWNAPKLVVNALCEQWRTGKLSRCRPIMNEMAPIKLRTVRLGGNGHLIHFHLSLSAQKAKAFRRRCERIVGLTGSEADRIRYCKACRDAIVLIYLVNLHFTQMCRQK